jgi:hypothetical protein
MPAHNWKPGNVPSSNNLEFINVADFHNASAWAHIRYAWFWITILKAILVFCGDVWTCVVLLISSTWTLEIKPVIPISVARRIFAGSLLSSCILWAFDLRRANKIIKGQDVSNTISNKLASWFYCMQEYDYFCYVDHITGQNGSSERMLLFHELQGKRRKKIDGEALIPSHVESVCSKCRYDLSPPNVSFNVTEWEQLILQAPRNIVSIMAVVALLQTIGFDLGRLDEMDAILPHLKGMDKLAFCTMAFTSLMFILSGIAVLIAAMLWILLVGKKYSDLKEDVLDQINKRIDAVVKKSSSERARQFGILEEMKNKEAKSARRSSEAGSRSSCSHGGSFAPLTGNGSKRSPMPAQQRPKPTLPDVDVIHSHEDIQILSRSQCSNRRIILQTDHNATRHHSRAHYDDWYWHYPSTRQPSVHSSQSGHAGVYNTHRNRYSYHHECHRPSSLVSANSIHTDRSFSIQYSRSVGCSPYQQPASPPHSYQQRERCFERPESDFLPLQGHRYHDPRPRTPEVLVLNDHPEYWPIHYGLVFESGVSETHNAAEEPVLQRPASGVLPETNDRYSMRVAKQGYDHREWPETADGFSFPRKGMAEEVEEQLTVSNRSISIGSRSSMTSQRSCTTFELSYATALRREKQQQQQQQPWNHYKPSDFLFNLQPLNPVWTARRGSAWSNSSTQ